MDDFATLGVECNECGEITEGEDAIDCDFCGADNVSDVEITSCSKADLCEDAAHHFGINAHVATV